MKDLLERFSAMGERCRELEAWMASPDALSDMKLYTERTSEWKRLSDALSAYNSYTKLCREYEETEEMRRSDDPGIAELAQAELPALSEQMTRIRDELNRFLLPYDPRDEKNVIVEIRAGAGGEEAALFVADLYRMYSMFACSHEFSVDLMYANPTELGGYREIDFMVCGKGAYSLLKYESGVHRVQRVPETESQGRIQTSTVTVAILPEVDEVDVKLDLRDVKMESCKSSGAGGQHINKTESAVRLTHIPTGIVVECQEQRSQLKNREKALKMLEARLYRMQQEERDVQIAQDRRSQVGSGERCERIRTYNFPQGRVTDHRIGLTLYQLESFLGGKIDQMVAALTEHDINKAMKGSAEP